MPELERIMPIKYVNMNLLGMALSLSDDGDDQGTMILLEKSKYEWQSIFLNHNTLTNNSSS